MGGSACTHLSVAFGDSSPQGEPFGSANYGARFFCCHCEEGAKRLTWQSYGSWFLSALPARRPGVWPPYGAQCRLWVVPQGQAQSELRRNLQIAVKKVV